MYSFLSKELELDQKELAEDMSLLNDLNLDGGDFDHLMCAFAEHFDVDIAGYRWYFHHHEERIDPAVLFFRLPPYNLLAVTPQLLLEAAKAGTWLVAYPPHEPPCRGLPHSALSCVLLMLFLTLFPWAVLKLILLFAQILRDS